MTMLSVYDRIGGQEAIMLAVDVFYKKVLDDPITAPFFEEIDMNAQAKKQVAFMACAFDGPAEYKGRDLRAAHSDLGLTDQHFDAVVVHLRDTLDEIGVEGDLIDEVLHIVSTTRDEVVEK